MKIYSVKDLQSSSPCQTPTNILRSDWTGSMLDILDNEGKATMLDVITIIWLLGVPQIVEDEYYKFLQEGYGPIEVPKGQQFPMRKATQIARDKYLSDRIKEYGSAGREVCSPLNKEFFSLVEDKLREIFTNHKDLL